MIEHDGGVLLDKRENDSAKSEWFVPGSTVFKNEPRTDAVHNLAGDKPGESVASDEPLGTYEYFYETADINGVDSKHYLATGYRCRFKRDDPEIAGDSQYSDFRVFCLPFDDPHPYVQVYLDDQ